nr:MAG TPA: hypothetical protein [Bacteriophage sp.]
MWALYERFNPQALSLSQRKDDVLFQFHKGSIQSPNRRQVQN